MVFKPKKCRSLSLVKGRHKVVHFHIAGVRIPTVQEEPVKSLGRWYSLPLTDRHRGVEIQRQMEEGFRSIDKCGLPGKLKAWCFQLGLPPSLMWPLQAYEVTMTRVEHWKLPQKVARCTKDLDKHGPV